MPAASVLVVDDSRFVRASLVRALVSRFRVQQAESGERAWEVLLLDPSIGAVLSDLNMPGVDGFELLQRVRGSMLERVRMLPFAVLSGADDPAQRERARELGADRFVVKGDGVESLGDWLETRLLAGTGNPAAVSIPAAAPAVPAGAPHATPPAGTDSLERWLEAATARPAATPASVADLPAVLLRLHAPGLDALPARLRRGVRSADALHVEGADTAWLCVPASPALALRLALRFGLLAAGRQALGSGPAAARVAVCLLELDPDRPADALAALRDLPPDLPVEPGLSVHALEGPGSEGWRCALPWPAVRLLVA